MNIWGFPNLLQSIVFGALLLSSSWVYGDDTHYQDFLVGERALGLGGAFVSLADDPSGVYFNPAGLADVKQSSLQVSTSLYGFERGEINPSSFATAVPGIENLELDFSQLIVVPASAGFVKTFGKPLPNGTPRHAFGLVAMIPSFRKMAISSSAVDAETGIEGSYSRRLEDSSLWTGIGYGRKFGPKLRIGASVFYTFRNLANYEVVVQGGTDSSDLAEGSGMAVRDISLYSGNLLIGFGAKYHASKSFKVGLSLQLPTFELHSRGQLLLVRDRLTAVCDTEDCAGDFHYESEGLERFDREFKSQNSRGAMMRVGANYSSARRFTLSADVSVHFPVCYELIKIAGEPAGCDSDGHLVGDNLFPFVKTIRRDLVVNLNMGMEWLVIPEVSVAGGFFTDFSSAPRIPDDADSILGREAPNVDLLGMSMALGYFGEHSLSRVGFMYSFGLGDDVVETDQVSAIVSSQLESNTAGEYAFKKVKYFQSFMYVFISSTFRY